MKNMIKSLIVINIQLFALLLSQVCYASGFDEDAKRYMPVQFNNADAVVLVKSIKIENKVGLGTEANAVVINVVKQSKRNRVRRYIDISVPRAFLHLKTPKVLKESRNEYLRLKGCRKELKGIMKRHPSDKTMCEDNLVEIDLKLADKLFMAKANLGFYISLGWDFDLSPNKKYLIFLRNNNSKFSLFKGVNSFIPVDETSIKYLVENGYLNLEED